MRERALRSEVLGWLWVLGGALPALATQYTVEVDTSAVQGTRGALVFDLTSSSASENSVQILDFTHDGTTTLAETHGGRIGGDLILQLNPAPLTTIRDGYLFNELVVHFTSFGTSARFTLRLSENAPKGSSGLDFPDELSFFVLDASGHVSRTADPLGADALFVVDVDGTPPGRLAVFAPATLTSPGVVRVTVGR